MLHKSRCVSRSYKDHLVFEARADDFDVGVDVERWDCVSESMIKYFHVDDVCSGLSATEIWCAKEAFFKCNNLHRNVCFRLLELIVDVGELSVRYGPDAGYVYVSDCYVLEPFKKYTLVLVCNRKINTSEVFRFIKINMLPESM